MKKLLTLTLVLLLLALAFDLHAAPYPQAFAYYEDGSFVLFLIAGCTPFSLCTR